MSVFVCLRSGRNGLNVLLVALCVAGPAALQAESTNAPAVTLAQVRQAMEPVETVFTRFTQERHLSLFTEPLHSEGYLCCEKPGKVRWETTVPYRSIMVSDGSNIAQFEWTNDRWKQLELGQAEAMRRVVGQIASVMEGGYAREPGGFEVSLQNSDSGPIITLKPKQQKMRKMLAAIEVHLRKDLKGPRRVVLRESGGDYTDISFEGSVVNLKFPEHTFDCVQPVDIEQVLQAAGKKNP